MAMNQQQAQMMIQKVSQIFSKFDLPTLQKFYQMALQAAQNPQAYGQIRQQAISAGVPEKELPPQFNQDFVNRLAFALQIAMTQKQQQGGQQPIQMPKSMGM
jgi:hypothetical protein